MNRQSHPLLSPAIGTHRELVSFHFGAARNREKIYIQASLHADETPAMLTTLLLKRRLLELERQGALNAEVVLVPVANPVGLAQYVLGQFVGRFDLASGKNFNRHFFQFPKLVARAREALGPNPAENVRIIRRLIAEELAAHKPLSEFESLQLSLLKLSFDADVVIDLHCSLEAAMHLYTSEAAWPQFEPLARYLGAQASLLATNSGGEAFDETHSLLWWRLQKEMPADKPVPNGAIAVTVECRGQRDVSYEAAQQDADAILDYLAWRKAVVREAKPLPPLPTAATPLAGSEQFYAPVSGILVHRAKIGDKISVGQPLFDIVDPLTDETTTLTSNTEGVFYMRRAIRFVTAGAPLGRVTGARPFRTGVLLGA
ncbi:succinylglutamate desuccinylase/aspartoacylase family protein [bacterium M00.F.Ca.ET.228.01.1.1]|uniref:succinylglutamate desuccinylase/aspartoacylase family protein n=1 Tax=Paraburkholderia phenoliruptrix TaxID=252970 RepID=UPI0010927EE7|nr:succinylglutamate desuccinylase/aspartoacylase family protein [Paraburkholderia phenoliruptrix]TGP47308.1 succinylglutamate desuccinylase/aspartoacylase family protein [bacterium M00.F.Ca.ET.228.01.1.1]TGS05100.1 succinylglutamate desuccinylase/aspartoacylase family protein [bacterium M00.F.Ca.ET.191.01.1.1]TGU10035.1 succinylglutamate desuccinylase/aspartoacylase family protein [bacterium M00.F.Ca.ET.155.01.1.1]MBW0446143.1 succinylglutamate desuccinylase/aspartoacylase family protein [Para